MPLEVRAVLALSNGNLTKEGWDSVDGMLTPCHIYVMHWKMDKLVFTLNPFKLSQNCNQCGSRGTLSRQ